MSWSWWTLMCGRSLLELVVDDVEVVVWEVVLDVVEDDDVECDVVVDEEEEEELIELLVELDVDWKCCGGMKKSRMQPD